MTFDELYQLAVTARQTRALALDIAAFAPGAAADLQRFLGTAQLALARVHVAALAPNELVVRGAMQVGLRIECEARFYREGQGIGYALTFATQNPLDLLKGDLARLADLVPIDALWWTASSRAIDAVDVAIAGLEAKALRIAAGLDNFHLRIDSQILDAIGLADTVFQAITSGSIPSFSVAKRIPFALRPLLTGALERLTVGGDGSFRIEGQIGLKLLGVDIPPVPTVLALSPTRVALRLPIPDLPMPKGMAFQAVMLRDSHAEMNAALPASQYGVAMDGRYILPGGAGHGGTYRFEYTGGNTSPIPDTIELSIDMLTMSDVLNLMTPVPVRLPAAIDRLVVLRNGYAHYAVGPGATSASGAPLPQGIGARASVSTFGFPSYFAAAVRPGGLEVQLLMNPLKLGKILAIRGTGVRPPADYAGPAFLPDAIGFAINTAAGTASAALIVDFLGTTIERIEGKIEQGGLSIATRTSLPGIADVPLTVVAGERGLSLKGGFEFRQPLDLILEYGFRLRGPAKISGTFEASQPPAGLPELKGTATLELLGFSVSAAFKMKADDIEDLAETIYRMLLDEARRKLLDAVELVRAFLNGVVQYASDAADAARKLAQYLAEKFEAGAEEVISIMKRAGATAAQALELVREGAEAFGRFAIARVVDTIRIAYSAAEALDTLRRWAEQFGTQLAEYAQNIAWLLREGGYQLEEIAAEAWRYVQSLDDKVEAFVKALGFGGLQATDVARQLAKRGIDVDAAGKIIGRIFGTDILQAALVPAYGADAAARVAGNAIREMGRFSRNLTDEIGRFGRRLGLPW